MYSYYPMRNEVADYIKDAVIDLKIAFGGLFKEGRYEQADKVFDALDALSIVLSDLGEPQNVWTRMQLEKEIAKLLDDAKSLISDVQKLTLKSDK